MEPDGPGWIDEWRAEALEAGRFSVEPMDLSDSEHWARRDGAIRHASGRYFSIVGVRRADGATHPLIDQPEVGLLAFAVTTGGPECRWLGQMKIEPGNVRGAQIAPTVQATRSNREMVHRGRPTPLRELAGDRAEVVGDGHWSEQGTRFLRKANRNLVVSASPVPPPPGPVYRWISSSRMRRALAVDFAVNTDARSVIAMAPWELIGQGDPFTGDLAASHRIREPDLEARMGAVLGDRRTPDLEVIPLEAVAGATLTAGSTPLRHPHFDVVHRRVVAATREVETWDQPLVTGHGVGEIVLVLAPRDGILRAHLGVDHSPALPWGLELTATRVVAPGGARPSGAMPGRILAEVRVSDEGGRFDHEVSTVTVLAADEPPADAGLSVTLGDLERIVRTPRVGTNELRTVVGVLLSLA